MNDLESFLLSDEETDEIFHLLEGEYSKEIIDLVHSALLISPRLIALGAFPYSGEIDLADPSFEIDTFHVAISLRIVGLSKYGLLYQDLLEKSGINGWTDICTVLCAIHRLYEKSLIESDVDFPSALWISKFVKLKEYQSTFEIFQSDPLFSSDSFDEVEFCDMIVSVVLNRFDGDSEEIDKDIEELRFSLEILFDLMKEGEEEDITEDGW